MLSSGFCCFFITAETVCSEDALMKANTDVTEALQRTIALMEGELKRSVLSSQLLGAGCAFRYPPQCDHSL